MGIPDKSGMSWHVKVPVRKVPLVDSLEAYGVTGGGAVQLQGQGLGGLRAAPPTQCVSFRTASLG